MSEEHEFCADFDLFGETLQVRYKYCHSLPERGEDGWIYIIRIETSKAEEEEGDDDEEEIKYAEYVWLDGEFKLIDIASYGEIEEEQEDGSKETD